MIYFNMKRLYKYLPEDKINWELIENEIFKDKKEIITVKKINKII